MNKQEKRYIELMKKAVLGGKLGKEKQQELNALEQDLGLVECNVCNGEGLGYSKGFDGTGDGGECFTCEGIGKVGLREEVKSKIKEVIGI